MEAKRIRLAMVVTHPIQYYVPLYRRLSLRDDLALKVFYTWHANPSQFDPGFQRDVHWDIPLTGGYDYQLLPNVAERPGSDHFFGIRNPELVDIVSLWRPDAVHITGYAYASHVKTMRAFHLQRVPVLFRGDSHLLDRRPGVRWEIKRFVLRQIFKWPSICLYVGKNNADYFRALGVAESRLCFCPHSIDVRRFAEPNDELENKAGAWRKKLGISAETKVLLFAGKFERKKCPLELMKAIEAIKDPNLLLIMVGSGELESEVYKIANRSPTRFRVLPFQNQSVMPIVYRLGDIFVLPSVRAETWGLGVNEALACGRRVLVSSKVGCGPDLVKSAPSNGAIFFANDWSDFKTKLNDLLETRTDSAELRKYARGFDTAVTESLLTSAMQRVVSDR